MAKAAVWPASDAEARKRGEQIGLDTLVVHAVNDEDQVLEVKLQCCSQRSESSAWGVCTQV